MLSSLQYTRKLMTPIDSVSWELSHRLKMNTLEIDYERKKLENYTKEHHHCWDHPDLHRDAIRELMRDSRAIVLAIYDVCVPTWIANLD